MKYLYHFLLSALLISVFLLLPVRGKAQHEASTWYFGNGYGLKFDKGAATVFQGGPVRASLPNYTYTDRSGHLVFYANVNGIFNKQGILMENGRWSRNGVSSEIYIIPKPGSNSLFYLFYGQNLGGSSEWFENQAVLYAIIDPNANDGAGKVIEKDNVIYKDMHGSFTVSGRCDNDTFWLVGEANTNRQLGTDQFWAYKINHEGIASEPVRSEPASIGNSSWLELSPKGDKIVFSYRGNYDQEGLGLSNFNTETGEVSKAIRLEQPGWRTEFSASGNMLYLSGLLPERPGEVWQFDLSSGNEQQIMASKTLIYSGPSKLYHNQLAPDGKIYFTQVEKLNALAVIQYPERAGTASQVTIDAIVLPEIIVGGLPTFTASFLYDYPVKADAGLDRKVCQGQQVKLGGTHDTNYTYRWEPALYLSDPTSATPIFLYNGLATTKEELIYTLYVNDGACERADEVKVTVLPPYEAAPITGAQVICPGLMGVAYSVVAQAGYTYRWTVTGGQIEGGQGTASVNVNWGPANPNARVTVRAVNTQGCESGHGELPVSINVQLAPAKPAGLTKVCLAQSVGIRYTTSLAGTKGSGYTWGIKGGVIKAGQGTNHITVDWQGIGNHKLWLMEQSTTQIAACFGLSDTLYVNVTANQVTIALDFVSIASEDGNKSNLQWQVQGALASTSKIELFRRTYGTDAWSKIAALPTEARSYFDTDIRGAEAVYEYKVATTSDCDEVIESNLHRTIRLQGNTNTGQHAISLSWNAYEGWPQGVASYEIWGRIDEQEYKLLHQVDENVLSFTGLDGRAGFQHHYRIRAVAAVASWNSWSNEMSFTFEHALNIPNIFTPNGDGHNDTFFIPTLELYSDNELVVVNRQGKEVYRKKGYLGTWTGENVVAGVYYYQLYIKKLDKYFKGWVEVAK